MEDIIKTICEALIEKAEAVIKSTERITDTLESHGPVTAVKTFALNRLDEVEHIQNLTLELTNVLSTEDAVTIEEGK